MVIAALLLAACGKDSNSTPAAAPSQATTACASSGELTMWERSGGNKQMVDMLVAAWNAKNPNCKIKLTYIPHTEMVGKIAQGIASGEVPDLMGMDLIYAPSSRRPSSSSTSPTASAPGRSSRRPARAT
jgi:multiple sugar transport system substrate-binding protein